jgi:hypothetical protein
MSCNNTKPLQISPKFDYNNYAVYCRSDQANFIVQQLFVESIKFDRDGSNQIYYEAYVKGSGKHFSNIAEKDLLSLDEFTDILGGLKDGRIS